MTPPVTQDGWTGRERDLASREIPASAPVTTQAARTERLRKLLNGRNLPWSVDGFDVRRAGSPDILFDADHGIAQLAVEAVNALPGLLDDLERANRALDRIARETNKAFPGPCGMPFMVALVKSIRDIATAIRATVGEVGNG